MKKLFTFLLLIACFAKATGQCTSKVSHSQNYFRTQTNAVWLVLVNSSSSSNLSVTLNPDENFTITAINAPAKWTCSVATKTCTRTNDGQAVFEFIQVVGTVSTNAPSTITNGATITGGCLGSLYVDDAVLVYSPSRVKQWGTNSFGQLNNLPTSPGFVQLSTGFRQCIGLTSDGSIVQWGNLTNTIPTPTGSGYLAISSGSGHSIAITGDGHVVNWGTNLGNQNSGLPTAAGFIAISTNDQGSIALTNEGKIVVWGNSNNTDLPTGNGYVAVAGGYQHGIALTYDGSVVQWGANSNGQRNNKPTGNGYVAMEAGNYTGLVQKSGGILEEWGTSNNNPSGGIPTGSVAAFGATMLSAASWAMYSDGSVYIWGDAFGAYQSNKPTTGGYVLNSVDFGLNSASALVPLANPTINGGNSQSATVYTAFATPLSVKVEDALGSPMQNLSITFTAPGKDASGTFSNGTRSITVSTDASGIASATFTANGISASSYSVTASYPGSDAVSFSLTNTCVGTGDPTVFGTNTWNVYAWNAGGDHFTGNTDCWNTNYTGYYTSSTLNINTRNDWNQNTSPSFVTNYVGCLVGNDNHSWSAKRQGFTCGYYQLDVPGHDDGAQLWINGSMVWSEDGYNGSATTNVWKGNLGTTDKVEFRVTEGVGGSFGKLSFTKITNWYLDADGDGYYTSSGVSACSSPGAGYRNTGIIAGGDCNDNNAAINPGATEVCNGIDDNCDGQIDEGTSISPTITAGGTTTFCQGGSVLLTAATGNNALQLNGTNQYLITPDLVSKFPTSSMTIELWFKADAGGVIVTELGQSAINTAWHDTHIELLPNGHVMVRVWQLNAVDIGTVTFGTWHHAAVRYSAATNILDGALDGVPSANTVSGARQQPNTNAQYWAFGAQDGTNLGSGNFFNGQIDEIRIWNTALSNAQIAQNYNHSIAANAAGLVAYYKLDESTGSTAFDATANANNGTTANAPLWVIHSGNVLNNPSYLWSSTATTTAINVSSSSSNIVEVTVSANCKAMSAPAIVTVSQPTTSETTISVCNKYSWNGINPTVSGTYTWHGTNAAGCDSTATLHLTIISIANTFTKNDAVCYGTATGSISIAVANSGYVGTPPYTYRIGTVGPINAASGSFSNLKAGTYRAYMQDAVGCIGVAAPIVVAQPPQATASVSPSNTSCNGVADGRITISNPLGNSPFMYKTGLNGSLYPLNLPNTTVTGLKAGDYRIYIQDATGCVGSTGVASVQQPADVMVNYTITPITCANPKGAISLSLPGNATGTFKLNPGGNYTNQYLYNNLPAGTYYGYAKDAGGCTGRSIPIVISPATACTTFARIMVNTNAEGGKQLSVYPNPAVGNFMLQFNNFKPGKADIVIMNESSLTVEKRSIVLSASQNNTQFSMDNKEAGTYFIKVTTTEGVQVSKVVMRNR